MINRLLKVLAYLVAGASFLSIVMSVAPGPLYATGSIGLGTAFSVIGLAFFIAAASAVLGLAGSAAILVRRVSRTALLACLAGLVMGTGVSLSLLNIYARSSAHPLHDISTDLDNPPRFEILVKRSYPDDMSEASEAVRATAFPHPDWRSRHAALYPNIVSQRYAIDAAEALDRARSVADELGWAIAAAEPTDTGAHLEAVDTTGWFAFQDNIVVRITKTDLGVTIDARSVSRIGRSDLGANAKRLRTFFQRFEML